LMAMWTTAVDVVVGRVGPNLPTLFRTAKETLCVAALPILILVTF
jgi:hypothetical protein